MKRRAIHNIQEPDVTTNLSFVAKFNSNLLDSVGLVNGTISGTETYVAGMVGNGISLNGSSYVDFGDDDILSIVDGSGNDVDYTFSFWYKPTSTGGGIFSKRIGGGANNSVEWLLGSGNGELFFGTYSATNPNTNYLSCFSSGLGLATGVWYHIVWTYEPSLLPANPFRLYVNSVSKTLAFTKIGTYTNSSNTTHTAKLGTNFGTNFITGVVDELYIYKGRVLRRIDAIRIYNTNKIGNSII